LFAGLLLYLIIFFTAPLIAKFYGQPLLIDLVRVLSLVFVINAFSFVQEARLTKEIRFKTLMIVHIPSTIIGGITSIIMAFYGFGVWSIIAMQLVTRLTYTIQIWIHSKWIPLWTFKSKRAKDLFSFGGKLFVAKILGTLYNNIFLVVLGKFYPVSSVGYYQNANNMAITPSNTISTVISGVTFPAFATIQDDDKRLKDGYKKAIQQVFFWISPLYVLAGVLAEPLFRFVFTAKWLPAVPYFQWLCVVAIFGPLSTYNLNIVNVKGRSDIFLKLQLIRRGLTGVAIFLAVLYGGIMTLLIVQASSAVFSYILFSNTAGRFINYSFKQQLNDISGILLLSIIIGFAILLLDHYLINLVDILRLIIGFVMGILAYGIFVHFLKLPPYLEFKNIFQTKVMGKFIKRE
jgi:O-antigen/teichoic acid export membrane protein